MMRLKECGTALLGLMKRVQSELFDIEETIKMAVITVFASPEGKYSHFLLEAPPGMGKTVLCKTIANWCGLHFTRIQLTPDMQPGEIVMTHELEMSEKGVSTKMVHGPIFTNILLADEINRTPPRTQSSILQPMAEMEATYGGRTYNLGYDMSDLKELRGEAFNERLKFLYDEKKGVWNTPPAAPLFYVFATQNPVENEGTYRLPEAQLDRFLFKMNLDYPAESTMKDIIKRKAAAGQYVKIYYEEMSGVSDAVKAVQKAKDFSENQFKLLTDNFLNEIRPAFEHLYGFNLSDEYDTRILRDEIVKLLFVKAPGFKKGGKVAPLSPRRVIQIRNTIALKTGIGDPLYYDYITAIMREILKSADFEMKVSPRFCDTVISVAKVHAVCRAFEKAQDNPDYDPEELFITKADINSCACNMLSHRVSLSYEAQSRGYNTRHLVDTILRSVFYDSRFRCIE